MLRSMFPGLTYAHLGIPLKKEGLFADAQTGEKHTLVPPGHLKHCGPAQNCEAVAEPVLSALTRINYRSKCLIYAVFKAETVNKNGLCFDSTPVFEAILSKDGTLQQTGEKTVRYWLKDGSDKLTQGLFQGASVTAERACQVLFGKSVDEVVSKRRERTTDTLFLMALNGLLRRAPQVNAAHTPWTVGVEIELTGTTIEKVAHAVASVLGGTPVAYGGGYTVKDSRGRIWRETTDGSIRAQDGRSPTNDRRFKVELISPQLHSEDIKDFLQPVIRAVRRSGGLVNDSCGIHVHISNEGFTPEMNAAMLIGLAQIFGEKENLLYAAFNVHEARKKRYAKRIDRDFLRRLSGCRTLEDISNAWYGGESRHLCHYDRSRYRALNLHSFYENRGVEIRVFNSTLHAGVIRAYIAFCIELCRLAALRQVSTDSAVTESAMNALLDEMGITDRNVRTHLTSALRAQSERRTAA